MDIDYNKLKSFLAVVQHNSVTGAAKALNRTQSAVSQAVLGLERQLGTKLIQWEGKRLKLTREGKLVFKTINQRMRAIEEQLDVIITSGKEVGGCIEVGILQDRSTEIQDHFLQIIGEFRKKYPAVTFKIHFGTSAEIEQGLLKHDLDIGLLINFRSRHRFRVFEIASEEHITVTSPSYLRKSESLKSIQDVIEADLIDIDESFTCFTPWIQKHSPSTIHKLEDKQPVITVPDFQSIKELVLLGQGIAVLPRYLIKEELNRKVIVQVLPKLTTLKVDVDCAVLQGRKERLCEQLFINTLND